MIRNKGRVVIGATPCRDHGSALSADTERAGSRRHRTRNTAAPILFPGC